MDVPKLVDAIDYMKMYQLAYQNDNTTSPYTDEMIEEYAREMLVDPDNYPNVDWQKEILAGDGFTTGHALSLSAAAGRINALVNLSWRDQRGLSVTPATSASRPARTWMSGLPTVSP